MNNTIGAADVKTYLDNFECGHGIDWSNPFDYHDTLIFQVILCIKKDRPLAMFGLF